MSAGTDAHIVALRAPVVTTERAMTAKLIDKLMTIHVALSDPRLLKVDVAMLASLIEMTNKAHGYAWGSVPAFAKVARISERYARQAIRKLESFGYLRIQLGGHGPKSTNRYYVLLQGGIDRSPLALPKHSAKTRDRSLAKGELKRSKGEPAAPKGGTTRSADTTDDPSYKETFRTHGTAASSGATAAKAFSPEKSFEQEVGRKLRTIEQAVRDRVPTADEREEWQGWLGEVIEWRDGHTGDSLGGWAKRLLEKLDELEESL